MKQTVNNYPAKTRGKVKLAKFKSNIEQNFVSLFNTLITKNSFLDESCHLSRF